MAAVRYVALTVGVVVLIGLGAYAPMILGGTSVSPGSTTTTTCTTRTGTSTQSSTTGVPPSYSSMGTFSYAPPGPVKVDSVIAVVTQGSHAQVGFEVAYENVGPSDIYYVAGCDSSLAVTIPAGNGVLQETYSGPRCLCAEAIVAMPPGANRTASAPGCWSGYGVVLAHSGTVTVGFTLYWGATQGNQPQDATNITATFTFA